MPWPLRCAIAGGANSCRKIYARRSRQKHHHDWANGVGKTEISRRLAKLAQAPFIKVEASKFTEVGYVGRDVESIIRDLTDLAVNMVKEEEKQKVEIKAREVAEERIWISCCQRVPPRRSMEKPSTAPVSRVRVTSSRKCCVKARWMSGLWKSR